MSCSASSNIRGQASIINPEGSNARTYVNINSSRLGGSTIGAGMTPGAVVRFDWTAGGDLSGSTGTYIRAKADNNENAEVVGVVESNNNGEIKIVTGGYVNIANDGIGSMFTYPTNPETGLTVGASGGNDIWFLSAVTAGHLQNLEPTGAGQVVKPVLQKVAHPDYNYQVINYIGYAVAGDVLAENLSYVPVGSYQLVPDFVADTLRAESGYVDASVSNVLKLDTYKDFYNIWKDKLRLTLSTNGDGTTYFYEIFTNSFTATDDLKAKLITTIANQFSVSVYNEMSSCFIDEGLSVGQVVSFEELDNVEPFKFPDMETQPEKIFKFVVSRPAGQSLPLFDDGKFIVKWDFDGDGGVEELCNLQTTTDHKTTPAKLTHFETFRTPVITPSESSPYTVPVIDGTSVSVTQKVILKVKETGAITAPQKLFIDNLKATGLTAAGKFSIPNYTDVEATLTSYENRISILEG